MKLSYLAKQLDLNCVQDGNFTRLKLNLTALCENDLVFLHNPKFVTRYLNQSQDECVITNKALARHVDKKCGLIVTEEVMLALVRIHEFLDKTGFYGQQRPTRIAPSAVIHPSAYVAKNNVIIGEECYIGPQSVVHEGTTLEEKVILQSAVVVGDEGSEIKYVNETPYFIRHTGFVQIQAGVRIGSHTSIGKGVYGTVTRVGRDTCVGSNVRIGHDVTIEDRVLISSGAVICGSTIIEQAAFIGPMVCLANGLRIGRAAKVKIGSVVVNDVPEKATVAGNFAVDMRKFARLQKSIG